MSRSEVVTLTNMCMVYDNNRVLVQNRIGPGWPGIAFPGGHVEKGESFTDSVIREIFEETGLKIRSPKLCGIKDWINKDGSRFMVLLYKTDKFEGELSSSEEGEVFWTEIQNLKNLDLADGMEKQLEIFLNDDLVEQFFFLDGENWIEEIK